MNKRMTVMVAVALLIASALGCVAYSAQTKSKPAQGKSVKAQSKPGGGGMMGGHKSMGGGMGMGLMGSGGNRMMGRGMGMMLHNPMVQKQLGLTDDQKSKLKSMVSDTTRKSIRNEADIRILKLDLKDLTSSPKPNMAKIDSIIDEIASVRAAESKLKIHATLNAKAVLTPEQAAKLTAMQEKMRMGAKMGKQGMKGQNMNGKRQGKWMKNGNRTGRHMGMNNGNNAQNQMKMK